MIDEFLGKKYKFESSENWDEFMKAIGVGYVPRKVGNAVIPVIELTKNEDHYILTTTTKLKTVVLYFKPGEECDQETADDRMVKSTITIDGNVLHEVQVDEDGKKTFIERTFSEDHIKTVMRYNNITTTRLYKLQT